MNYTHATKDLKASPPPIYKSPRFRLGQFGGNFRQKGYMIGLVSGFRYDFVEFVPRKGFGAKET